MPTSTQRFRLVGEDDASRAFLQVAAASKLLKSNIDDVKSSFWGFTKLVGGASGIPVIAGATAATVELTTALGAASGAAGIFGISAVGTLKGMLKAQEGIKVTEKSLGNLTKGTTAYSDAAKKLHAQQVAFHQDYGKAAKGYDDMTNAWGKFLHATGPVTQGTLGKGFDLIASVLPKLVPVSNAAGHAIGGLIDDLSHWTEGPAFAHLLHFLETSGPKDITAFGHSIGNVLGGLGGILGNFVGPGDNAAKTLEHLTQNFDKWGHSKGVSKSVDSFLKYVHDNGPEISSTFKSLGEAAPKIATALGQLGGYNLSVTSKFLNLVAGLPQKQFNLIADALFAIAAGAKAVTLIKGLGAVGLGLVTMARGGGSLLGKGGSTGGSVLGGVQKVYVVNMGAGGMGGGPGAGGPAGGGGLSTIGKLGVGAVGFLGINAVQQGSSGLMKKLYGDTVGTIFGKVNSAILGLPTMPMSGIKKQAQVWDQVFTGHFSQALNILKAPGPSSMNIKAPFGMSLGNPFNNGKKDDGIKSVSTHLDALRANLAKTSRSLDMVGNRASDAFNNKAVHGVQNAAAKLQRFSGVKAEQAFDLIGHSAAKNTADAAGRVDILTGKIKNIPARNVKIGADTSGAMSNIQSLIAAIGRIHDKTVHINSFTNATIAEHVTGPTKKDGPQSGSGHGATAGPGGFGGSHVSWWDSTGSALVRNIVGHGKMPLSQILAKVRGARANGRSKLQATLGARNSYAAGFQSFASSAFGADYGTDPTTGAAVAPTISSILAYAQQQRDQAHMVDVDVHKLVKKGLSPALLKQLQAAGAAGIPTIEALAGASKAQIAQYNSLNKQTSADLRSAGMAAGNAIYGKQIRKEEKHNAAVEHLLKQLVDMAKHRPDQLVARLKGDHIDLLLRNERRRKGKLQSDKTP